MDKLDKFLFGMGLPNAGIENKVGMDKKKNEIVYGEKLYVEFKTHPILGNPYFVTNTSKTIKNSLIFMNEYIWNFPFDIALITLSDLYNAGVLQTAKIDPFRIYFNRSIIENWFNFSPVELGRIIEIAKRKRIYVLPPLSKGSIYFYAGTDYNGIKTFENQHGDKIYSYRSMVFKGYNNIKNVKAKKQTVEYVGATTTYSKAFVSDYTLIETERDYYIVNGPYIKARIDKNYPFSKVLVDIENEIDGWVLISAAPEEYVFKHNAGPFKVYKIIEDGKTSYEVWSVSGKRIYTTRNRKIGENLNFKTLKNILT